MSHIATTSSSTTPRRCRDYGRAIGIAAFYALPMALKIRQLREARGLTQADLADKAGMSRSQLAMIEAETRPANTLRLNAIAAALGVQPQHLFDDPDAALIALMNALEPEDRAAIVRMAEALASKRRSTEPS